MARERINVAFIGGGLSTLIALGGYSVVCDVIQADTYSGASMGATIAVSLAVGKTPLEIRDFLAQNAFRFCIPLLGKEIMRREVNEFLGNIKFKDLPVQCFVSIALSASGKFWKDITPMIVTRENAGEWTVGDVIAMSSSVPILYLPSILKMNGKKWKVFDGGLAVNPPFNPDAENVLFSYENPSSRKDNSWNKKARWPQEKKATALCQPYTDEFGMLGGAKSVYKAFEFGENYMKTMPVMRRKIFRRLGIW